MGSCRGFPDRSGVAHKYLMFRDVSGFEVIRVFVMKHVRVFA
jgi:hypothetical protein